jgi:predicted RNase H-related nuclease YkuK (DUF458 family)
MKKFFISPTKGKLDFEALVEEIANFVLTEPEKSYKLIVGTDSNGKKIPTYVLAVVIYRKGSGGRFFYQKIVSKKETPLKAKIYQETMFSLNLATKLRKALEEKLQKMAPEKGWEIHTDIGQTGPTRELIQEITALVQSNGFEIKIKPESFGASVIADRCLK